MLRTVVRSHRRVPPARPMWHTPLITHVGFARGFCVTSPPRPISLAMPELPEISHGNVGAWLVQPGDEVKLDQALVEIETADAVFDFEAPEDGFIAKICVPSHSKKVAVKEVLALMVKDKGHIEAAVEESENPEFESTASNSSKSQVSISSSTTTTTTSSASSSAPSSSGDPSHNTFATDTASPSSAALPAADSAAAATSAIGGQRRAYSTAAGFALTGASRRGAPLAYGSSARGGIGNRHVLSRRNFSAAAIVTTDDGLPFLMPAARHLVIEHHVDPESLRALTGSLKGGRISKWDILKGLADKALKFITPVAPPLPQMAIPTQAGSSVSAGASATLSVPVDGSVPQPLRPTQSITVTTATRLSSRRNDPRTAYTDVPLSAVRSSIASSLLHAKQTVPHAYAKDEVRMERLWRLRTEIADTKDVRLDIVDFVTRAVAVALNRSEVGRQVNVVWDEASESVVHLDARADVALSVATGDGEVRATIDGVAGVGLAGVHDRIQDLRARASEGSLHAHEVSPSKPTAVLVADLSSSSVTDFTGIVRAPHSAVVSVSAPRISTAQTEGDLLRAAAAGGGDADMFSGVVGVHLSWDSRAFDESVAVEFLKRVRAHLENPESLL